MGETVTIKLKKPLISPEGEVHQVVLREPTYEEFLVHGDPYVVAASKNETRFMAENLDTIAAYIRICLVEPKDPQILVQANARLAREMKTAMLSFFHPDVASTGTSETSPTT